VTGARAAGYVALVPRCARPLLVLTALLGGCPAADPGPATPGSPSAALAERAAAVAIRARDVAARADALAGEFDAIRADPEGDHTARIAALREEAAALGVLARETQAEVTALEASAQVW
jgi:hypothetical protein